MPRARTRWRQARIPGLWPRNGAGMLKLFADHSRPGSWAYRLRQRRMAWLLPLLEAFPEPVSILDVGGTLGFWSRAAPLLTRRCRVTLGNLEPEPVPADHAVCVASIAADGRSLGSIPDLAFDICFSNSVIEHVGAFRDQQAMASEVRRVARAFFIQTPNRAFPMEPHFLVPGWQFLPETLRVRLHQRFNLGWMPREPDLAKATAAVRQIQLLTRAQLAALFPNAEILAEQFGPLVKSWVARTAPSQARRIP